ncbi:hypothetical protein [Peribacillus butanolivorans]|uniref:hypothetical protein n=1 Tax=Peribacillus butanolivorans TaxID=421767 RepID=UPI00366A47F0
MTAEVSVMNTIGVALAADSAVTIGRGTKIYNSANKLFALSKYHPIGIMIYGNAGFMRMPWETIIKVYRNLIGPKSFNKVSEYGEQFVQFLKDNKYEEISSKEIEEKYTLNMLSEEVLDLFEFILERVKSKVNEDPEVKEDELFKYGDSLLERILNDLEEEEFIADFNDSDLRIILKEYDERLDEIICNTFENFVFSDSMVTNVKYIIVSSALKRFHSYTGVVIAGFGENELYPSLVSYQIEGRLNGKLKYSRENETKIGLTNTASIIPFAQSDMVHTFIRGVDPDIESLTFSYLEELFKKLPDALTDKLEGHLKTSQSEMVKSNLVEALKTIYDDFEEVLNEYKEDFFTTPILSIVNSLPKEELADMAEALVNLTSFKRKVSSSIESVGGPIDVAVITKGDGFVWIKRKHYFDTDKNQQFHQKYFWRDNYEPTSFREEC